MLCLAASDGLAGFIDLIDLIDLINLINLIGNIYYREITKILP